MNAPNVLTVDRDLILSVLSELETVEPRRVFAYRKGVVAAWDNGRGKLYAFRRLGDGEVQFEVRVGGSLSREAYTVPPSLRERVVAMLGR